MKEFLLEALNSAVGERLADCIFVCAIVTLVQFFYNKKLAEHQTRFKYWHEEKSKAIKEFYYSAVLLYQEMREFRVIGQSFAFRFTDRIQKELNERIDRIFEFHNTATRNWICLRLFLKEEELTIADSYFSKENSLFNSLANQINHRNYTLNEKKIDKDLIELSNIVEDLREDLQAILKVQDDIFKDKRKKEQDKSPIFSDTDSSKKDEVK